MFNKNRILIIRRSTYPKETHVLRNITTLLEAGFQVELICLKEKDQPVVQTDGLLRIYRVPLEHRRDSLLRTFGEYWLFFFICFILVTWRFFSFGPRFIEVDSMPNFLVFSTIVPRLLGGKVILYMFELIPETYCEKLKVGMDHPFVRIILLEERLSALFANYVIVYHELMMEALVKRGIRQDNMIIVYNVPLEDRYNLNLLAEPADETTTYFIHHGLVAEHYGLQYLLKALKYIEDQSMPCPLIQVDIVGSGEYIPELKKLAEALNFKEVKIVFWGYVSDERLVALLKRADAGILPLLSNMLSPNKLFDLAYFSKPVLCSRVDAITYHFPNGSILYFNTGDIVDTAEKILYFISDKSALSGKLRDEIAKIYKKISWKNQKHVYLNLYKVQETNS